MSAAETPVRGHSRAPGRTSAGPVKGVRKVLTIVPAAMVAIALVPLGQAGAQSVPVPVAVISDAAPSVPAGAQDVTAPVAAVPIARPKASGPAVATSAVAMTDHAHVQGADHAADCAAKHSGPGSDDAEDCPGDGSAVGADHAHADGDDHDHAHADGADHAADCAANHGGSNSDDATDCA